MISEYHKTRSSIDFNFIENVFVNDDRKALHEAQEKHPNSIIKMRNHDLISSGYLSGYGGSIPADWDGTIIQL
jgi:hypothetical protein